jgi:predicted enzyme related to lactoylglutathione lyase
MATTNPINYIEFPASDIGLVKTFYSSVFNWKFVDYGPEYSSFENAGVAGGFYFSALNSNAQQGAALVVLHSNDLESCLAKVVEHGGSIKTDIFSFPGGRRFHFTDPCQNELAVWTDTTSA